MAEAKKLAAYLRTRQSVLNMMSALEAFQDSFSANDIAEVPVILELVNKCHEDFVEITSKIEAIEGEGKSSSETVEKSMQEQAQFHTRYCRVKGFLLSRADNNEVPHNASLNATMVNRVGNIHLRLPKIDLPSFDGDVTSWLTFRDRFKSMIHASDEIPTVMKLQYLLASLKGEAARQFEHTAVIADNYSVTWSALLKKYDDKRMLIREYFRTLHFLPGMRKDSIEDLVKLVDDFSRHVKGLERLEEPVDNWDTPLTNMLFLKLDDATLLAWETHSSLSNRDEYTALLAFLQERIKILKSRIRNVQPDVQRVGPSKVAGAAEIKYGKIGNTSRGGVNGGWTVQKRKRCPVCGEDHELYRCSNFGQMSVDQRIQLVSHNKHCFNCLHANHVSRMCVSKTLCRHCKQGHHSMLCRAGDTRQVLTAAVQECTPRKMVFLATAVVQLVNKEGLKLPARALIDSGAQRNFLSERLVQQLHLKRVTVNAPVTGVGTSEVVNAKSRVSAKVTSVCSEASFELDFLVLPKLVTNLPAVTVEIAAWNIPTTVVLADPQFCVASDIDMIIGAEVFYQIILNGRLSLGPSLPTLVNTQFGWIVSGPYYPDAGREELPPTDTQLCATTLSPDSGIEALMEAFFQIEELDDEREWSIEEQECEDSFCTTTTRDENGRYVVRLPRKESLKLGESKGVALHRFNNLERRFGREPNIKNEYQAFMEEYLALGHMSLADVAESARIEEYYLPHHAVFKEESTTTKCRVVFDASSKTSNGVSLNDTLKVGPTIQETSMAILMRWRTRNIALVADVTKMYRQVWVHKEDRRLQRVLWRGSPSEPIRAYELNTVTYGMASAPFLAIRALQQTAVDHGDEFPAAAARVKDFYVDDFISGASTLEEAKQLCREAKSLYSKGGFELRKWASNERSVLPRNECAAGESVPLNVTNGGDTLATLGLVWNPIRDTLSLKMPKIDPCELPVTKRRVARVIARIFDPLGLADTVKARAKQFMQELWRLQIGNDSNHWDCELPSSMQAEWMNFATQLKYLTEIAVPRNVIISDPVEVQLHGFCDASEKGLGACVYVRSVNVRGQVVSHMLVSKSKVVSLKTKHSIARLELCAALLLAKLVQKVHHALEQGFPTFCWTDSTTVLHWLRSSPSRWKTFVGNRVAKIQRATTDVEWRHVPGTCNPADAVSRGRQPQEITQDRLWWHGPDWLVKGHEDWPNIIEVPSGNGVESEAKGVIVASVIPEEKSMVDELVERSGTFSRLKRVVAYCLRFCAGVKCSKSENLSLSELRQAELTIVRLVQEQTYGEEKKRLCNKLMVRSNSPLKWLAPILDEDGVIRVGGRLNNAVLSRDGKHPIVLPGRHRVAKLIAQQYHTLLLHAGTQLVLNTIRQRFWIVGGRNVVKHTIHQCVRCSRCRPTMLEQPMAVLPAERVRRARPFEITGVDYAGPLYIKGPHRRSSTIKGYVSIFVCFVTKAVHLELVSDLTTLAFLAALRRFTGRRGLPVEIHSDNGTNFKGASNHLNELYILLRSQPHQSATSWFCTERGIKWSFTPPAAPHFGGLWEAAVKSMKYHLTRVLGDTKLAYEDMFTLIIEVEACLNSRPLTQMSEDPNDLEALTPGHFLIGANLQTVPDAKLTDIPINRMSHWRQVQAYTQHIWRRWHVEYLQALQKRTKWVNPAREIKEGQLVIIKEENTPVCRWKMARIANVHPGEDGIVRVVTLYLGNGKRCRRPIAKLAVVPIE